MQEDELVTSHPWRVASFVPASVARSPTAAGRGGRCRRCMEWDRRGLHIGARSILRFRRWAVVMVMAASVRLATRLGLRSQVHYT